MSNVSSIEAQVHLAYEEILGRLADSIGLHSATSNIIKGTLTLEQLRKSLFNSEEYRKRNMHVTLAEDFKVRLLEKTMNTIFPNA